MGINTDLNIDPYFDDFDETKQFNRVLFKPARAVQARELTQLQTILQNQVERFGSNVYKEGTIISGINFQERKDIFYVKLNDQVDFTDPTIYEPTDTETYSVVGETSNLRAEIIKAENGFQTRNPDLKTFFIKYLNTGTNEAKQFIAGEVLSIRNSNDEQVFAVITASVEGHAGRSHAVSSFEGIIYQKGHFIYVEPQFVITEKYSNVPDNVSIGFEIEENIVTSNQDQTLLDNAQGYNNENAPGADRLQLKPILRAYDSDLEPDDFFALIRYSSGRAITIRDVTQFNSIATEMARRTYDESGNYVVKGMNVGIEQYLEDDNLVTYATVSPGKAYVDGYEVSVFAKDFLVVSPETTTITKANQGIGASYSGYFTYNNASGQVLESLAIDGTRYPLRDSGDNIIGYASVANVEPGKIYVYAVEKTAGQENTEVAKISATPVTSQIIGSRNASMLFDSGRTEVKNLSGVSFTRRFRLAVSPGTNTITIEPSDGVTPLTSNIVVVDSTNQTMGITNSVKSGDNVSVTVDDTNAAFIYYDAIVTNVESDSLVDVEVYVKTEVVNGKASLGLPNVIKAIQIIDNNGTGADVTSKFVLVNNQKEGFYDISYLQLRTGETLTNSNVLVRMVALRRSSVFGNAYLDAKSYQNVEKDNLKPYTNKQGVVFDLPSSVDFRPYATPFTSYAFSSAQAPTVTPQTKSITNNIALSNNSTIFSDQEFYLSRIDSVVVDSSGVLSVIKGIPSDNPVQPKTTEVFPLSTILIPGGERIYTTGQNAVSLKNVSTRNYTMEDIENIDKKVDRLTDAVTLSLLELETNSLFIDDGTGNNRFKNGILVDNFKDANIADFSNGEYKAAIDSTNRIMSPAFKQFPIDLKLKSGNNVNTGYKDVISLADTGSLTTTISQRFATDVRNATSNFYQYNGQAFIFPQFDSAYDVVQNPSTNVSIDIATPILDLVDNIQEFIPLTRSRRTSRSSTTSRRVAGGTRFTTSTQTTTTTNSLTTSAATGSGGSIGNFVTDVSFRPYMRRREVQILVTGLRPNTIHHFFFDADNVDQHVFPAVANPTLDVNNNPIYDVRNVARSSSDGSLDISTDENGILAAVFVIPENTFFVGDIALEIADASTYTSLKSARTSYAKISYHAYTFGVEKTNVTYSTRTVDFDVATSVSTSRSVSSRFVADPPPPPPPPPPQAPPPPRRRPQDDPNFSCFVAGTQVTMADGTKKNIEDVLIGEKLLGQDGSINTVLDYDHPMLNGRDLIAFNGGKPFMTPEHPLWTKEGWKSFSAEMTQWQKPEIAHLMVNGDFKVGDEVLMDDGSWFKIESIDVHSGEPEQQVFNFYLDGNNTYFADGFLAHNRGDPSCFVAGTKVTMADGTKKNIEEVIIGEKLLGQDGAINTVLDYDHPMLDGRSLIAFNGSKPFMTPEHPLWTKKGWKSFSAELTQWQKPAIAHLMTNGDFEVGDEVLMDDGSWFKIESIEVHSGEPEQQVFNFFLDGNNTYFADGLLAHNRDDPLAQTFFIKNTMAESASSLYVHSVDLFFKGRSDTNATMAEITSNGITVQMREVVNGYPSAQILPFGEKHLSPGQVLVSGDSSVATNVVFDNPVKLDIEKEYAVVLLPDANDPNYLVYIAKVGGTDIASGVPITQDWGDGVLFTSTNNRAWQSYQDEDVKFNLKTYNFTTTEGFVELVPNDPEFFTINTVINEFISDELVYAKKSDPGSTYSASVSGFDITVNEPSVPLVIGDYAVITQDADTFVSKIVDINSSGSQTVITVQEYSNLNPNATGTITLERGVAGKVEYFNRRKADILNLTQSSARTDCRFEVGDELIGYTSGATAIIATVEDIELSYFQPMIYVNNTVRTSVSLDLYEGTELDKPISLSDNTYMTTNSRKMRSKSRIVDNTLSTPVTDDFVLRMNMTNNGFVKTTPILDAQLSMMNVYRYEIEDDTSSSSYIAKEVILQEDLDATGLKVILSAYRPVGTYIDVYARFVYPANGDDQSDWIQMENSNPDLYSNISNIDDFRDFEYNLSDETNEFSSFQIKIVMRHATDQELSDANLNAEKTASIFPHINDYRAIALT